MYLHELALINFKSYAHFRESFSPGINLIVGPNGSGKTNLLDSIHMLAVGRGAFNHIDAQHIRWKSDFFTVKGSWHTEDDKSYEVQCSLERGKRKLLRCDNKEYERVSDHYGRFPVVLIAPYDTDLIREGNEIRRRFFDSIIAQLDRHYLNDLFQYQRLLKQRNEALKKMGEQRRTDPTLLAAYDAQLLPLNERIAKHRAAFTKAFWEDFIPHHQEVARQSEQVAIGYQSDVQQDDFDELFRQNQSRDLMLQRTELGVHRDKYLFRIGGRSLKKFGSQGQQKTFVLALKLTQFEVIRRERQRTPVLLLDDIFDKLDTQRTRRLIELVRQQRFGQVFITDATPERAGAFFQDFPEKPQFIYTTKAQESTEDR